MSVLIAFAALAIFYFFGYRVYSVFIEKSAFSLSDNEQTPAHDPELQDGVDYLPVKKSILWGHHYTSIAGAAPIIGPAVAVIWGWLPALIWIVLGTIFIGAVHDYGALVLSARNRGRTMGDLAGTIIKPRVRILFQIIIYFLIWIVLAVFAFAIGVLFKNYPATVIPVNFEIIVALLLGWMYYKKKVKLLIPSLVALVLLYAFVGVGLKFPLTIDPLVGPEGLVTGNPIVGWAVLLLIYAAVASVIPVWLLLQPRDYINSHQLVVGLVGLLAGLVVLHPSMSAPAINPNPAGAPSLFPMIFVTIACGAISGFHGLVSSGTTSKQIEKMSHARPIGYGGMLGEGTLAVIATLAVAAGLKDWGAHYHHFNSSGINAISNFVLGAGSFLNALGLSLTLSQALVAVLAISFAATSMDTAARVQRLVVSELGEAFGIQFLRNRYWATLVAVGPAIPLVMAGAEVWGPLWMLFGTTNQLIGAMTLLVLYVYLTRAKKPRLPVSIPLVFLVIMTTGAMLTNLWDWIRALGTEGASANMITILIGAAILALEIWMIIEAVFILKDLKNSRV